MLMKKLGVEAIETDWPSDDKKLTNYFKIPPKLNIPEDCKRVGICVFNECWWLKKVEIPEGVDEIDDCAFWDCKNATIILKKSSKDFVRIGVRAFYCVKDVKEEVRS